MFSPVRCQSSETCENPVAHSCDQCGHLVCNAHREVVSGGLEEQVVCHDCRPGPPTEQLAPVQAEELSHAPTELLNPIHIEEHLAGPRVAESQPLERFAEADQAPADVPPAAAVPLPDPGPTEVLPVEMQPTEMSPAEMSSSQLLADEDEPITAVAARTEILDRPRADPPRAETRRAKVTAAAGAPHRRALRRPGVPARGTLKDDVQGPLVILAVLCAVVAIVGGINHNSFLGLTGGLLSGAAVVAVIIIGLTSPKK